MNVPCECVMCTRSIEVRIFNRVYVFKKRNAINWFGPRV